MAINTEGVYSQYMSKYRPDGSSQEERFDQAFFYALSRIEQDLAHPRINISVTMPEDQETVIDLDSKYLNVIFAGIDKYMQDLGEWGMTPKEQLDAEYELHLRRAAAMAVQDNDPEVFKGDVE